MTDSIQQQAHQILDTLASIPFEQCQPITRSFNNIPPRPGLYAVRHRTEGLRSWQNIGDGDRVCNGCGCVRAGGI